MAQGKTNILITAGGTTEKIDGVRGITNTGTGRLGALTADAFARSELVGRILYVCSAKAARPRTPKAEIIVADDTQALEEAIEALCASEKIDAVVHSMAVSDYRTRAVTTPEALAAHLCGGLDGLDSDGLRSRLAAGIMAAPSSLASGKISSGLEGLVVLMEPTPKIIGSLRGLLPDAVIVGFKLLNGSDKKSLLDAAFSLLEKNDCDYVLANDLADISGAAHIGRLIDRKRNVSMFRTKEGIALGIVSAVLSHFVPGRH